MTKFFRGRNWRFVSLAVANIGFAIFGAVRLIIDLRSVVGTGMLRTKSEFHIYYAMITLNAAIAVFLLLGSGLLLRSRSVALRFCMVMFVAEFVYCITIALLWIELPANIGGALAAVSEIGNPVIVPQLLTAYPLIALILLRFYPHHTVAQ